MSDDFLSSSALLLRYLRDIEFFLPFELEEVFARYGEVIEIPLTADKPLPWENRTAYNLDPEYEYAFDVFLAPFRLREIIECLSDRIPELRHENFPDSRSFSGLSCFLRLNISDAGALLLDDTAISTLPWALKNWVPGGSLSLADFDEFGRSLLQDLDITFCLRSDDNPQQNTTSLTHQALKSWIVTLVRETKVSFFPGGLMGLIVPLALRKRRTTNESKEESSSELGDAVPEVEPSVVDVRSKRKVEILNSFYLRDLERVHAFLPKADPTSPLHCYLSPAKEQVRIDVFQESARPELLEAFAPDYSPKGRWPAPIAQSLAFQQQLALNLYLRSDSPIFAVNGPPGTGKTTLVRDLLAHLVVSRALVLSELSKPELAFERGYQQIQYASRELYYRRLIPKLRGFELLVASNNNAAVENISLELPRRTSLSDEFLDVRYLQQLVNLYQRVCDQSSPRARNRQNDASAEANQPWGFPSLALGNARNRGRFRRAAFLYHRDETEAERTQRQTEGECLTLFEMRSIAPKQGLSFHQARAKVRNLYKLLLQQRETAVTTGAAVPGTLLPSPLRSLDWQCFSPHGTPEQNKLLSDLFIASLQLHEAWVREVPFLEKELFVLSRLIGRPQAFLPEDSANLWPLLFMIVPCVSTTLASVERMCATVPAQTFGHLVIEEAGQATPHSALGALMRARRALIIGDQRQLEPVVSISEGLERVLAAEIPGQQRQRFSPLLSSVQSLADEGSRYGTWIADNTSGRIWLGCPLSVHRRCKSPMFDIANSIAYDGMMLQAVSGSAEHAQLGVSKWIDIKGAATAKQWVPQQGEVVLQLLRELLAFTERAPDVFVITPFREVRSQVRNMLRREAKNLGLNKTRLSRMLQRVGTVHLFQGREAEIVIFVLGCDHKTHGAALWAGEKPNLLNVAVTRARSLLYVVGDVDLWHNKGYFSDLHKALPVERGGHVYSLKHNREV